MARATEASGDLLEQLVDQFSDPFAFYRELIQNSIDAGSTRIEVTTRYAPPAGGRPGLATAAVADWGEGMSRAIIEKYLLTKFRSSKEDDLTKIGKFGIGFMSVFAPRPELVVVDTGRDGEDWRLLFHADRSYELLRAPEPVEGTRVALHKEMSSGEYLLFAERSESAVRRWCRHSEVDVAFAAGGVDGAPPPAPAVVREPFLVDAPFQVEYREEGTRIVAGPARSSPPFCGFYNRGLTLLTVEEELVPGVTFKIASRWLEHTLTRDNVRRDRNFGKAMALVKKLAEGPLRERLAEELRRAAERPEGPDAAVLLRHAAKVLDPKRLVFPLAGGGALDGAALKKATKRLGFIASAAPDDPMAAALAAEGIPTLPSGGAATEVASQVFERPTFEARHAFTLAVEATGEPERALAAALLRVLRRTGFEPERVIVGRLLGAASGELSALVAEPGKPERALPPRSPFKAGGRQTLCFNTAHPRVASAVAAAAHSPEVAALLCARLLAIAWGALGDKADAAMLEAALSESGEEP